MFEELANGVFRRRYESLDLNVGVVLGEQGILVVDTRASHVEADELREELRTLTTLPVRWVVDTHWHWDHTFGNARFPEAEIWGHELCRKTMVELGDSMKEDAAAWLPDRLEELAEVVITPPTSVFESSASIDLGRVVVEMTYHGRGHTDSDIVVTVGDVSFMGDLLEEGAPPVFDDGFPMSWPVTLESAAEIGSSIIVPGHGDTLDRAGAAAQLEEIRAVADLARRCLEEGFPVTEAAILGPYPPDVMASALERALAVGH
jgi:glyoxylase-like metal-dependent hydrolase (beta-lactamase superfamily II)